MPLHFKSQITTHFAHKNDASAVPEDKLPKKNTRIRCANCLVCSCDDNFVFKHLVYELSRQLECANQMHFLFWEWYCRCWTQLQFKIGFWLVLLFLFLFTLNRVVVQISRYNQLYLKSTCIWAPRVNFKHTYVQIVEANEPKFGINELEQCNVYIANTQVVCDCSYAKCMNACVNNELREKVQRIYSTKQLIKQQIEIHKWWHISIEASVFTVQYIARECVPHVESNNSNRTKTARVNCFT